MRRIKNRVQRETPCSIYSAGKERPIVIELFPYKDTKLGKMIGMRFKGSKKLYYAPMDWLYREMVRAHIARSRRDKTEK